jgi:hypothetical protein
MTAFDDGLWTRLVDEHRADRIALGPVAGRRSRRPLVVGVSGVAAAGVAGVLAAVLSLRRWSERRIRRLEPTANDPDPRAACRDRGLLRQE